MLPCAILVRTTRWFAIPFPLCAVSASNEGKAHPPTRLECADPELNQRKPFGMNRSRKQGEGAASRSLISLHSAVETLNHPGAKTESAPSRCKSVLELLFGASEKPHHNPRRNKVVVLMKISSERSPVVIKIDHPNLKMPQGVDIESAANLVGQAIGRG
jgi:hypothetical protein